MIYVMYFNKKIIFNVKKFKTQIQENSGFG
ncbi:Uncharacterised protein [Actinobacillus pleuropneumoniae]|nr:Uncharacterised protein [Actinobacillus pleuropneumoniae]